MSVRAPLCGHGMLVFESTFDLSMKNVNYSTIKTAIVGSNFNDEMMGLKVPKWDKYTLKHYFAKTVSIYVILV